MISSFYALNALATEIKSTVRGFRIGTPFSQSRSELIIPMHNPDGGPDTHLRISTAPNERYLFMDPGFRKAKRNVADLFDAAVDRAVESVAIAIRDRCIFVGLTGGYRFALALTGSSSNVYLVDAENRIAEAFQDNDDMAGADFTHTRPAPPWPAPDTWSADVADALGRGKPLAAAISSSYAFFDRQVAAEIIDRAYSQQIIADKEKEADVQRLYAVAHGIDRELLETPVSIITDRKFCIYEPVSGSEDLERFDTVNDGIKRFKIRQWKRSAFDSEAGPVLSALEKAVRRLEKSVDALSKGVASPSRTDRYSRWGDMLMASTVEAESGAAEIVVPDWEYHGKSLNIPIKPGQSRVEAAEYYYDRARSSREQRKNDERRLSEQKKEHEVLRSTLETARKARSLSDWREFASEHEVIIDSVLPAQKKKDSGPTFRSYELPHGYAVFVGKNAAQNDRLTMNFARKEDYWLHARGLAGSHVVLRTQGREEPPERILSAAASIAAYHSKGRTSGLVPVIAVRRKYVRKRKGSPPGTVTVERENVLLVEPKLPRK